MVINRIKASQTDSDSFYGKVKDMAGAAYLGMDTDREQRKPVRWRHRRPEAQEVGTRRCTDRSHSHKPGEIRNVHYKSILCYVSGYVRCSGLPHF